MKALLIVLIVLVVFLLIPLGVDGGCSKKNFVLNAKLGILNIRIWPRKKKPVDPTVARIRAEKKALKKLKKKKKEKKGKIAPNFNETLGMIKIGLKTLSRFRRHLSIDYLRLHYIHAAGDPSDAALGYGYASVAMGAFLPLLDAAFNIRERDFEAKVDFFEDKPDIDVWITATIQIWELFYIGFALLFEFLPLLIKEKKELKRLLKEKELIDERNKKNG